MEKAKLVLMAPAGGGEVLLKCDASPLNCIYCRQLEDTGRYSCLANSPAGDDDKGFLVRVHGKTPAGETLFISCCF